MSKTDNKALTIRLKPEVYSEIENSAMQRGVSKTDIVRERLSPNSSSNVNIVCNSTANIAVNPNMQINPSEPYKIN